MKKTFLLSILFVLCMSAVCFAGDVALTSVGQGSDATMAKVMLKSIGFVADFDAKMTPETITNQKVLVLVVGGSSKGLGAAGIKKEDELVRVNSVIKAAQDKQMKILVMHIGGQSRRGATTDDFITAVAKVGDAIAVVETGNKDGIFNKNAKPGAKVESAASVNALKEPVKAILTSWGAAN